MITREQSIIIETVEFYEKNPRAVGIGGTCKYHINGRECAVGRCLTDAEKLENELRDLDGKIESGQIKDIFNNKDLSIEFKEPYAGLSVAFWDDLQDLHDYNMYWEEDSPLDDKRVLSDQGVIMFRKLLKKYGIKGNTDAV